MRIIISTLIKQAGFLLTAFATKIEDIPEILQLLVDFLKKEPEENYSTSSFEDLEVPLTLSSEAVTRFKSLTNKFPSMYISGLFPDKEKAPFNLVYIIGQVLTNIAMVLEYLNMHNTEEASHINALYHIWGSMENMNARSLVNKYKNKSTGDAKKALISKLEASIRIVKEEIIPLL